MATKNQFKTNNTDLAQNDDEEKEDEEEEDSTQFFAGYSFKSLIFESTFVFLLVILFYRFIFKSKSNSSLIDLNFFFSDRIFDIFYLRERISFSVSSITSNYYSFKSFYYLTTYI